MGRAAALHLARAGFRVFAGVRNEADGRALLESLLDASSSSSSASQDDDAASRLEPVVLDVTSDASVAAAATAASARLAATATPLVAVVNNAGCLQLGPLEGLSLAATRRMFDVNVFGVQRVCKAFAPLLRATARDWMNAAGTEPLRARLVNVSSIAAFARAGHQAGYSATKAALDVCTEALRQELEPHGVDAVLISPYFMASDMGAQWGSAIEHRAIVDELVRVRGDVSPFFHHRV